MTTLKTAVIPITLTLVTAIFATVLTLHGLNEGSSRELIRVTAGSSLFLFALAFSASSINQLLAGDQWRPVVQARRRIGIAFAISHSFHLAAIIALVEVAFGGDYSQLGDVFGGAAIYLFIYLMALTSNNASVKLLGARRWKYLHKVGSYAIWIGLTVSYIGGAIEKGAAYYWLYSALCLALLAVRIFCFWKKRAQT